jgi:hypothetical protein
LRAWIEADILYLHADDVPSYKKNGSMVRNSYFWALRSIAAQSPMGKAWEFETAVWYALQRMLSNFMDSGYLGTRETQLEFREDAIAPSLLHPIATWIAAEVFDAEPEADPEPEPRSYFDAPDEEEDDHAPSPGLGQSGFHRGKPAKQSFRRKAKHRPEPEERPSPPYSSYIKKP